MSSNPVHDRIAKDIGENDVLLYMKGTPVFPQCGFSAAVVQVLSEFGARHSCPISQRVRFAAYRSATEKPLLSSHGSPDIACSMMRVRFRSLSRAAFRRASAHSPSGQNRSG